MEWEAPTDSTDSKFGYNITINDFQFDGEIPDLQGFFALLPQGFDFSQIEGLSWDGLNLHFPDFLSSALEVVTKDGGIQMDR